MSTTFRGKRDPYITMPEVRDQLNAVAGGKSAWTTQQVRRRLQLAGALTTFPEDETVALADHQHRISARRHSYTTLALLQAKLPELFKAVAGG